MLFRSTDTELFTDHQPLVWLCSQPTLSRKQTRWVLFLQRFQFSLKYIPGKNNPADAISRAPHLEFPAAFHDTSFESYDPVIAFISTQSDIPRRVTRSTTIANPGVLPPTDSSLPPPQPNTNPKTLRHDDIVRLRQLARSGFQHVPVT